MLYIGMTNDVQRRSEEPMERRHPESFTGKYGCTKLVWFEEHGDPTTAIAREKQLKNWKRDWKKELVREMNPRWEDLALSWK